MKYNIGDIVRVLKDNPHGSDLMQGDIVKITSKSNIDYSLLKGGDTWYATDDFLELVPVEKTPMNVAATGGLRDNKNKPRLSVVPSSLTKAVAEVIFKSSTEGGGKYPMHNWRKGLPWTQVTESAMRHLQDFIDRKDFDKESGLHTLHHAATNIAFLIEYLETCPQMDDRYKPETK